MSPDISNLKPGPGKTTPRLVADLLDYDPRYRTGKNSRNLLAHPAPHFKGVPLQRRRSGDCHHTLIRKEHQTTPIISQLGEPIKYTVAAVCTRCRCHFRISVDFSGRTEIKVPCNLSDKKNPVHHLRVEDSEYQSPDRVRDQPNLPLEYHRFACSGTNCPVVVEIEIFLPRLTAALLSPISDNYKLRARGTRAIQEEPTRYPGLGPLLVFQVYLNLKQYLHDALATKSTGEVKRIAKRNKKFCLAFGNECDDLFNYLGFTETIEEKEEDGVDYFWQLPTITDNNRNFIDDVIVELKQLISDRPREETRTIAQQVTFTPISATKDIEQVLGFYDYPKRSRFVDLTTEEHPYYASLGVVDAFTDELLGWAYDRQCQCDPQNSPYYLDCLYDLATGRRSSDLETKVSIASSTGELRLTDIEEAYKFFALNPNTTEGDDHILGVFNSRIQAAPKQADQARASLRIIGKARNSHRIESVATDKSMSYEDALTLLPNVDASTSPESVQAVAISVLFDDEIPNETKKKVPYALLLIGKEKGKRNDLDGQAELLKAAFDNSFGNSLFQSDVIDAYRALQLTNRSAPDETVWSYHLELKEVYKSEVFTIAMDRKSTFLLAKLDPELVPQGSINSANAPVGLNNIGNTCYLNSILQYYYTVNPFRNVVTDIDNYRMDLDSPTISQEIDQKIVGGRKISRLEVENAQKFVYELKNLFEQLKTASTSSVAPTNELANLTLLSDEKVASIRRDSVASPSRPPLEFSQSRIPVYGPQLPPDGLPQVPSTALPQLLSPAPSPPSSEAGDVDMVDVPTEKTTAIDDDSSDTTLVDNELPNYEQTNKIDAPLDLEDHKSRVPRLESPTSDTVATEEDVVMVNGESTVDPSILAFPEPEKPPPVPPRKQKDSELWAFGAQQDVTEVIGNVLFRLQCAIKPERSDEGSGEQLDLIRDTFYGANATYTQKSIMERKVEPWANLIIYPDPVGTRDIYAALDVTFDMQIVDVENMQTQQYSSIVELPPVLQMHIQRTAFDDVTKQAWKNMNTVTFPETLYMDRYMDSSSDGLLSRRQEAWEWKAQLRKLEQRQSALKPNDNQTVVDILEATKSFISDIQELDVEGIDIDPGLHDGLEERIPEVRAELYSIEQQIASIKQKLKEQFTDMTKYEYRLQTVFIHKGDARFGHYWIYVHDFENNIWREYNDERVSETYDLKQIFEKHGKDEGTPYYLAYVRSADKENLVSAVVREVLEVPIAVDEQIAMSEVSDESDVNDGTRTKHVENVKPRNLLPKPPLQQWESMSYSELDANKKPW